MLGPHKADLLGVLVGISRDYVSGRRVARHFLLILASLDLLRTNKRYNCPKLCAGKYQRSKSSKQGVEINRWRLYFSKGEVNEIT